MDISFIQEVLPSKDLLLDSMKRNHHGLYCRYRDCITELNTMASINDKNGFEKAKNEFYEIINVIKERGYHEPSNKITQYQDRIKKFEQNLRVHNQSLDNLVNQIASFETKLIKLELEKEMKLEEIKKIRQDMEVFKVRWKGDNNDSKAN